MSTKVSKDVKLILGYSLGEAQRLKLSEVSIVLFLYSIIKFEIGIAYHVLINLNPKIINFIEEFDRESELNNKANEIYETPNLSKEAEECLKKAAEEVKKLRYSVFNTADLLQSIFDSDSIQNIAGRFQIDNEKIEEYLKLKCLHLANQEKADSILERLNWRFSIWKHDIGKIILWAKTKAGSLHK